jgi:hypothetical protein
MGSPPYTHSGNPNEKTIKKTPIHTGAATSRNLVNHQKKSREEALHPIHIFAEEAGSPLLPAVPMWSEG